MHAVYHFIRIQIFFALLLGVFTAVDAKNWMIPLDSNNNYTLDFSLDPYYSAAGVSYPLSDEEPTVLDFEEEDGVLMYLIEHFHQPKSGLVEFSLNPLPIGGAYMKSHANSWYEQAEVVEGLNLVEAVTLGFPDPGAFSIFFGNRVYIGDYNTGEIKGIGYGGALLNLGTHHILKNTMYKDFWAEGELKLKASAISESKQFSSSFRVGGKIHSHELVNNSLFFSIKWDQTDKGYNGLSLVRNANIEFRVDANMKNFYFTRYLALYGKKVPLMEGKYVLSLAIGALRIEPEGYERWMRKILEDESGVSLLIQPNLSF